MGLAKSVPELVLEYLTEGNTLEDLAELYWEKLTLAEQEELEREAKEYGE